MTEEMFEILIGKFLDGEITPSEQRLLEARLDRDPQAVVLLEQFQNLHERSSEVVAAEVLEKGKSPEEIIGAAFEKTGHHRHKVIKMPSWSRFVLGAAAGLIIGLGSHFVLPLKPATVIQPNPGPNPEGYAVKKRLDNSILLGETPAVPEPSNKVIRNVDYYIIPDKHGNQWLVQGLRENSAQPAAYVKGL